MGCIGEAMFLKCPREELARAPAVQRDEKHGRQQQQCTYTSVGQPGGTSMDYLCGDIIETTVHLH